MKFLILLAFGLVSCSQVNQDKKVLAWEEWKGLPVAAISKNAYLKSLPITKVKHEDGLETWVLRDQARFQTGAYCQSLGGCMGMPMYNCDNAFSVKDDVILDFEQNGSCPGVSTIEAPRK